jgi:hypothetical protein
VLLLLTAPLFARARAWHRARRSRARA